MGWYRCRAEDDPAWPALVEDGRTVGYGELVERIAGSPAAGPAARLVLDGPREGVDWIVALLGALDSGGQAVLADPGWTTAERQEAMDALPAAGAGEAGVWLFTSGTTARPKPRFRSVEAFALMLDRLSQRLPASIAEGRPSGLCIVPLHHGFGLLNALLLVHYAGGTVHLGPADDPALAARLIHEHGIDVLYAWPSHFAALAEKAAWAGTTSLRWCVSSSNALVPAVAERFAERSGCPLRQQYGTTETGPVSVDSDDPPDPRCVGRALAGIDLRIVDGEGQERPAGEEGRIAVRQTDLFFPGDRGWKDTTGRLFVTARELPFYDERAAPDRSGR